MSDLVVTHAQLLCPIANILLYRMILVFVQASQ